MAPIRFDGRPVAWAACFVHVADVGAVNPGGFAPQAPDIFSEGFSSPGMKLMDRGTLRRDVLDTILNTVRSPEMVTLDLRSMIACCNEARDRMQALIAKSGPAMVDAACARLRDLPLAEAGGAACDTGDGAVVLRHFCCPGSATLLETETAMAGDPPLVDRLAGA